MEYARLTNGTEETRRSLGSRISNLLFLVICVVMLFSISLILFDRGAVMLAEEMVSTNPPTPW